MASDIIARGMAGEALSEIEEGDIGSKAVLVKGYFYNTKFYQDSAHQIEITPSERNLYCDITAGWNNLYEYDGTQYNRMAYSRVVVDSNGIVRVD